MESNGLQIIKNENFNNLHPKINKEHFKKKKYLIRFTIFITLALFVFSGVFFIRDRFENMKSFEENLSFQKQKLIEERLSIEKRGEELSKLKLEYEEKNKKLNESLNSIKVKERDLEAELNKARELSEIFKKQVVDMYGFNLDKKYENNVNDDEVLNSDGSLVKNDEDSLHTNGVGGVNENEDTLTKGERVLSVADADWFMKLDSLGEFSY